MDDYDSVFSTRSTTAPWSAYQEEISCVDILEGVTYIGEYAFYNHNNLTTVNFPDGLTGIGRSAFQNCEQLAGVDFPESLISIGMYAFNGCDGLQELTLPDQLTSVGDTAFGNCKNLTRVIIPNSLTELGRSWFVGCESLTQVTIPDTVTKISSTFERCVSLRSIDIPDSVTTIGDAAFQYCTSLSEIKLPAQLQSIGENAFLRCESLKNIDIPDSVTSIAASAFRESGLTAITIPGSVAGNLGGAVFQDCASLADVVLEDGVTTIPFNAFSGCSKLVRVSIPNSVTEIENRAFYDCASLTDLVLPDNLTEMGNYLFSGCSSLTSIEIPDGVTELRECTFYNCTNLAAVLIPSSVTTIGEGVFEGADSVTIYGYSGSVAQIYADEHNIPFESVAVSPEGGISWYYNEVSSVLTILGTGEMEDFDAAAGKEAPWQIYASLVKHIVIKDGVTKIGAQAFKNLRNVETILIPDSVKVISSQALDFSNPSLDSSKLNVKILFSGDAPTDIALDAFGTSNGADIYYPETSTGWDDVIQQKYIVENGQILAWIPLVNAAEDFPVEDTWPFDNYLGRFTVNGVSDGYYITSEDYERLLANLTRTEKFIIMLNNPYNIDGTKLFHCDWAGSCAGMAITSLLANAGEITPHDFGSTAANLQETVKVGVTPKNILSFIHYYHFQQKLPSSKEIELNFMWNLEDQAAQIKEMERIIRNAEMQEQGAFLGFAYKKSDGEIGNHAVVAYAVEDGLFQWTINGKTYQFDRRILFYDSRFYGDSQIPHTNSLYFNSTTWAIPAYNAISTTKDIDINSNDDTAQLKIVTMDPAYINAVDYVTGEINFSRSLIHQLLYTSVADYFFETFSSSSGLTESVEVKNSLFNGNSTIFNNMYITGFSMDSVSGGDTTYTIALPDTEESCIVTTDAEAVQFSLVNQDYYLAAASDKAGTASFSADGAVSLQLAELGEGYLQLTANENIAGLPWHTLGVISEASEQLDLSIDVEAGGVILESDDLSNITIMTMGDSEEEVVLTSTFDKVLLTEEDGSLAILGDADGDGAFETPVATSQNPDTPDVPEEPENPGDTPETPEEPENPGDASDDSENSDAPSSGSSSSSNRYAVNIENTAHGTLRANSTRAEQGDTVTITAQPDDGYVLDRLIVTDRNGDEIDVAQVSGTRYTFEMPRSRVSVEAVFTLADTEEPDPSGLPFTDVVESAWYYDAVAYCYENGLMSGVSAASFRPADTTTRGMIVTILHQLAGEPAPAQAAAFPDVAADAWYADAVSWAAAQGVVAGYDTGRFGPNDSITREQLAVILYRYAGSPAATGSLDGFADRASVSDYAVQALRWAVGEGLLSGKGGGLLDPTGTATRAEAAQILMRFCEEVTA